MAFCEEIIRDQRKELKKAHNKRFFIDDMEYKLDYEGGFAEGFGIYRRPVGARNFKYVIGFSAYKFRTKEQVISFAKSVIKNI